MTRVCTIFLVGGFLVSMSGFVLRTLSVDQIIGRVPPYMGPPVDESVLYHMRMWTFPYNLDTMSLIGLGVGVGLVVIGIVASIKTRVRHATSALSKPGDFLTPYR